MDRQRSIALIYLASCLTILLPAFLQPALALLRGLPQFAPPPQGVIIYWVKGDFSRFLPLHSAERPGMRQNAEVTLPGYGNANCVVELLRP